MSNKLKDELTNDPLDRGYTNMSSAEIYTSLYTKNIDVTYSRRIVMRDLLSNLGPTVTATIMSKAEEIAKVYKPMEIALIYLKATNTEDGLDFGNSIMIATINGMANSSFGDNALTPSEVAALLGLAHKTISRAEDIGLSNVRIGDIERAIA